MLKKLTQAVQGTKGKAGKMKKFVAALSITGGTSVYMALPTFAATGGDLATVTGSLTDGAGEMKTNGITIVTVVIGILIIFFGIGWLIAVFRKNMNKAN
ncbi:hypothetical protein GC101_22005 [Paenibacillus sp. LMG 31459]|uniref:Uncharacterized protein n=1 Tax=Paenibacillus phytohabitans TaxID=2654978 RepID=A0ABX1YKG1_9BACL|nr:major capsid protein [Paenibacillus phytohabitans]NOU81540.1 hypothetical protein [Paenibacillus phytohabitans]